MSNVTKSKSFVRPLAAAAAAMILAVGLAGCSLGGTDAAEPPANPPVSQPAGPSPTPTPAQPAEPSPDATEEPNMVLKLTVNDQKYQVKCGDLYDDGCDQNQQWVWNDRIKDDPTRLSNWLEFLIKKKLLTKTDPASLRLALGAGLDAATEYFKAFDETLTVEENLRNGCQAFSPLYPNDSEELKKTYFANAVVIFWGDNKNDDSSI